MARPKALIERVANVNDKDTEGRTALYVAYLKGNVEIMAIWKW